MFNCEGVIRKLGRNWQQVAVATLLSLLAMGAHAVETAVTFQNDAQEVLSLVEASRQLRTQMPGFVDEAALAMKKHKGAIPAEYTLRIGKALATASDLRTRLFGQALRHRGALYRVDEQLSDEDRINEIVIGMAAAVTMFENHKATQKAFAGHGALRNKLNEGYPEFGIAPNYFDTSSRRATNPEYRKAMGDAVRYFADNHEAVEYHINQSTESVRALYQLIAKSPVLADFKGASVFKEIVVLPVKAVKGVAGLSMAGLDKLQFTSSKVVGNTMGMVRWRDGKLKGDKAMLRTMLSHLQPGDILLEKSPFTLTDKTIPGHFGHVAIYVGSEAQLREMNAHELPNVKKHLDRIAAGHGVVEALRNGVQLDRLEDFMNVDDVAILRPKNLGVEAQREAVNLALGNLGKKYDFNFDVNTTETIVCSELAYLAYPQVDFVTKRVLGSFTVSPDDIAQRAGRTDTDPLEVVLFAHDGHVVLDRTQAGDGLGVYDKLVKGLPDEDQGMSLAQNRFFKGFLGSN